VLIGIVTDVVAIVVLVRRVHRFESMDHAYECGYRRGVRDEMAASASGFDFLKAVGPDIDGDAIAMAFAPQLRDDRDKLLADLNE
jgi:hypothetical protein